MGINHFTFFGTANPLVAPTDVRTRVVSQADSDAIRIEWCGDNSRPPSAYAVIAFPCGIGRGSGGFKKTVLAPEQSLVFDGLKPDVSYVFIVFGVDENGFNGVPSVPSEPISISSSGWTLLEFSQLETVTTNPTLANKQASTGDEPENVGEMLGDLLFMKEYAVEISPEKAMEVEILQLKAQQTRTNMSELSVEAFAALYEESIKNLNQGFFDEVDKINVATTVIMFLSSTFDDTTAERNYLMEFAHPILKSFCQSLGLTFSVVDLRWGVRNEATDDHMTIDVCLGELERCMKSSTAASFVFLSGERYGWRALPNRVLCAELDQILEYIPEGDAKETLRKWYIRDDNKVPPEYILQKISWMREQPIKYNDFWNGAQSVMQDAVRESIAQHPEISPEVRRNWMISVTEREVLSGLFGPSCNMELSTFVLMRTIEGLEHAARSQDAKADVYFTVPDGDRGLLSDLRARVKALTPTSQFKEFSVPWCGGGISFDNEQHCAYIRDLAAAFVAQTQAQVRFGLAKRRPLNAREREVFHHGAFALRRARAFFGRDEVRNAVKALMEAKGPVVRCLHGLSGTGKTSAMSVAAVDAKRRPGCLAVVVFRACGTSAASSGALELMCSVGAQIAEVYGLHHQRYTDFDAQVSEFHRCLSASTANRPLVLFIDSLDQLSDQNHERSDPWRWLPTDSKLMPHTTVVVSVLPDTKYGVFQAIRARLSVEWLLEIGGIGPLEALSVLTQWVANQRRQLQEEQLRSLEHQLREAQSVTMLHLRLIHDRVIKWRSYDAPQTLPSTVAGLIGIIFDDLERLHGKRLVAEIMGLLSASRCGLSEVNLLDLVTGNDDVLGRKGQKGSVLEYHDPPIRRLPPLVFSRLRRDLGDYIVERGENGVVVLNLYHRQFWEAVSSRYYADQETRLRLQRALSDYFSGRLAATFPDRQIETHPLRFPPGEGMEGLGLPNRQKIKELGSALKGSRRHGELAQLLCDLRYIEAVFESGQSYAEDLLVDFSDCLVTLNEDGDGDDMACSEGPAKAQVEAQVTSFVRFVRKWFHALCLQPHLLPGLAANSPSTAVVARSARALQDLRPWVEWRNAPDELDACAQTQSFPQAVACCAFAPSASAFVVGTGDACLVFDVLSSGQLSRFVGHAARVQGTCFSSDGRLVLSGGREPLARIWNASNGEQIRCLGPHLGWVTACAWSCRHDLALTACANTLVHLWDPTEGVAVAVLEGHTGPVSSCRFIGAALWAVSGDEDSAAVVWDLERRGPAARLLAGSPVNCVDASRDGRLLAVAASTGGCTVWAKSVKGSGGGGAWEVHLQLEGHVSEVWACCFSPSGMELATGAADRVGRVFNTATGELLGKIQGHLQWVTSVSWAGRFILTGSCDGSTKLWERDYVRQTGAGAAGALGERPLAGLRIADGGRQLRGLTTGLVEVDMDLATMRIVQERRLAAGKEGKVERKADLSVDGHTWAFSSYDASYTVLRRGAEAALASAVQSVPHRVCNTTVRWHPSDPSRLLVAGHGDALAVMGVQEARAERQWPTKGWAMDASWAPNGRGAAVACEQGTVWVDEDAPGAHRLIGPPALSVCVDNAGQRAAIITMSGGGYQVSPTSCVILGIGVGGGQVVVDDPIVRHAKLQDRNCRWADGDRLVLVATAGTSALGCPAVSVFGAADGVCLARFCSPYASNFACFDVAQGPDGAPMVALADEQGRVFVLSVRNLPWTI